MGTSMDTDQKYQQLLPITCIETLDKTLMELQPQTEGNSELGQTLKYHKGHNEIW